LIGGDLRRDNSSSIVMVIIKAQLIFWDVAVFIGIIVELAWLAMPVKLELVMRFM